jgi:hypothetical protein
MVIRVTRSLGPFLPDRVATGVRLRIGYIASMIARPFYVVTIDAGLTLPMNP